jgi:peptidoglycan/LPS O-acetylase OafA/YrhL
LPTAPPAPAALALAQVVRGLACLLVALHHGASLVNHRYGVMPLFGLTEFAYSGVYIFLAISGLIIYWAHRQELGDVRNLPRYAGKRFIRVYPFYWLVLLTLGAGKLFGDSMTLEGFLDNAIFFNPHAKSLIVAVAWTLAYELVFYAVFAAFFVRRALGFGVFAAWFVLIALNHQFAFSTWFALDLLNGVFLLGLLVSVALVALRERPDREPGHRIGVASLAIGALLFSAAAWYCLSLPDHTQVWSDLWLALGFGIGSALLLLGSASDAIEAFFARRRWLVRIGDASYSIYLMHFFFQKRTTNLLRSLDWIPAEKNQPIAILLLVLLMGVAIGGGLLVHRWVEKPLLRRSRQWVGLGGTAR